MQSDFSIVRQDRFIEATRDSGYKSTESALSELIDNSIQARAKFVAIRLIATEEETPGLGRQRIPRVIEVAVADNGDGMDSDTLRRALRFGDSNRFNDRSNLGRFGMGLPNASVSQCKRVEVFSWQKSQKPLLTFIDVDEISANIRTDVPSPVETPIPTAYVDMADSNKGTLVVWKTCDRLDHNGKLDTLIRSLRHGLGRIFRYFLIRGNFEITINGIAVEPFDPLYLMPQARLPDDLLATPHGDTLKFEMPIPNSPELTSTVEVTFCLLPDAWQVQYNKDRKELQRRHIESTQGFSIVRAHREIDLIKSPYHAKHWTDTWYRVEIRFDPILDELFGVTHTKQHASIKRGTALFEKLREAIAANVTTMKDTIVARGKRAHVAKTQRAEETIQKVLPRLQPVDALEAKTDAQVATEIKQFVDQATFDKIPEERKLLEERLANFEVVIEYEELPGAPFYRVKTIGRSIAVLLNTSHAFYEHVYRRLEQESPVGKTGIDLLLSSFARSEVQASSEAREWYDDQRQEWSKYVKIFVEQLDELEEPDAEYCFKCGEAMQATDRHLHFQSKITGNENSKPEMVHICGKCHKAVEG